MGMRRKGDTAIIQTSWIGKEREASATNLARREKRQQWQPTNLGRKLSQLSGIPIRHHEEVAPWYQTAKHTLSESSNMALRQRKFFIILCAN